VPPTAALAIFFVLVGTGEMLYTAVIVFGVFPSLTQSIYYAATKDVDEHEIDKFYTLGASHFEVVYELIFLKILPRIFGAIRLVIGPVMVYLIAVEWLVGDVGFGYELKLQGRRLNMATVYFYLAILGTTGFLMDYAILTLRRKLCPYFGD
jgi:ABC-type nitrate/sulfonate/bicarbonate transport system permease component